VARFFSWGDDLKIGAPIRPVARVEKVGGGGRRNGREGGGGCRGARSAPSLKGDPGESGCQPKEIFKKILFKLCILNAY
jgi:hypothetical protein